jgi:hypothetical protein
MRRRDFTKGIVGSAVAWPLVARAQQPATPVIGMLDSRSLDAITDRLRAFRRGLSENGFVEGSYKAAHPRCGITAETIHRNTPQGIYTRLQSHASGRRSGDQLPPEDITAIASGRHQKEAFARQYIHENLSYRFILVPDAPAAYAVEKTIKRGEWEHGRPLLNPRG